ncbi:MAG: HAMP domain-containing histidine kinase [Gemmatimonadetes bacterium]|nr:HAMP domain-containing histidine kinase [Gemmatimonadota bacterium]
MPEEHLPHIFDRFYQVRATGRAGAGLGLAIARGLVEAHGSGLGVQSLPGDGTTFFFDLPVA